MDMLVRVSTVNGREVDVRGVELKDFSLLVVDPDDCVIVVAHD